MRTCLMAGCGLTHFFDSSSLVNLRSLTDIRFPAAGNLLNETVEKTDLP